MEVEQLLCLYHVSEQKPKIYLL